MSTTREPIIIIKKKKVHAHAHHGGAWKVAYADFVTAMMAFFIVLWLMSSSQPVKEAIAGYFSDPRGFHNRKGSAVAGAGEGITITKDHMNNLKESLQNALRQRSNFDKLKDHVQMTVTGEGLRIELLETDKGMFFENGQPHPTPSGADLLTQIAKQLGKLSNSVFIEGHTDSKPFDNGAYSNWELSADRANAARKLMEENGLRPNQVTQIRGYADQLLRIPARPEDASNRRISIIVQYPPEASDPEPVPSKPVSAVPTQKAKH